MDSYLKIIKKHILKDFKSYTIVIFSLVSAISLLSIILGIYKVETDKLNNEIIQEYGMYDAYLNGITYDEINILERHNAVEDIAKVNILGETEPLGLSESKFKIQLLECDKNIFYKFNNFTLIEGRLPEIDGECIISYKVMEIVGREVYVGDEIDIPYIDVFGIPKVVKTKVVGIIEGITPMMKDNIIRHDSEGIGENLLIYKEKIEDPHGLYRGYIQASGAVEDIYGDFKIRENTQPLQLKSRYSRKALKYNSGFTGSIIETNTPFAVLTFSIVILLVCINSISMIYKLKEKDLKNLIFVGANDRQIKFILLIEVVLLWLISSILSFVIIGILDVNILNIVAISSSVILIINFVAFIIMFKLKSKDKEIEYYYKADKIERRLAYSYYRNNMDRNRFSILSIGISFLLIVMFLNQLLMGASNINSEVSIDAEILYEKVATVFNYSEISKLKAVDGIKDVYAIEEVPKMVGIPITKTVERSVQGYVGGETTEENDAKFLYNATIKVVEDKVYDKYLKDKKISNKDGVIIDISTIVTTNQYQAGKLSEAEKIKSGEFIQLVYSDSYQEISNDNMKSIIIEETINYDDFGVRNDLDDSIKIIMRESTAKEILGFKNYKKVYIKLEDQADYTKINNIKEMIENKGDKYTNLKDYEKDVFEKIKVNIGIYMVMSLLLVILSLSNTIITLIFNIFTRKTERQLLAAIGMSDTQLKTMVRYENYYVIGKSIYVGLVLSLVVSLVTQLQFVRSNFELILIWIFVMIVTAIFIAILTLVITQISIHKSSVLDSGKSNINKM